MEERKSVKFEK